MIEAPLHLRVFLSSPGDVADERALARRMLKDDLAYDPFLRGRVTIDVVSWDDPAAPTPLLANLSPQEAINRGLPKPSECDIVIVILWTRLGTPLSEEKFRKPNGEPYLSGTEWEYEDALSSTREPKPEVLVYRKTETPKAYLTDPDLNEKCDQYGRVEQFFQQRFQSPNRSLRGGYEKFAAASEFAEKLKGALRNLLQQKMKTPPIRSVYREEIGVATHASPYPGLRAFTVEEAAIFFGRGQEVDELIGRLRISAERCIAVVGASGTGKSSLVRAGLLPRLKANAIPGSKDWYVIEFTPGALGNDPLLALAAPLNDLLPVAARRRRPADLAREIAAAPTHVKILAREALAGRPEWAELVFFVDQLEELFTLVADDYRSSFIDLLASIAADERLRLVATLRADFFAHCTEWPPLAKLLRAGILPLAPPGPVALLDMIRRPAEHAGLELEDGLAEAILNDAGTDPGGLPLMAFVLAELDRRRGPKERCLTLEAYRTIGGLKGAIGDRAARVVRELRSGAEGALPRLFQALVHIDAEGKATRRRADRAEVASDDMATHLLNALIEARLLQGGERESRPTIEVAHEAVFEGWPQLHGWLTDNRAFLLRRAEVEAAMARWEGAQRDPEFLLPPGRWLNEAVDLVRKRPDLLLPGMQGYVEASQERKRNEGQEDEKRLRSESMRLAELSQQETARGFGEYYSLIGILLALEALPHDLDHPNRPYVAAAEVALYQALWPDLELSVLCGHSAAVNSAAFSPDGRRIITASRDGTARLWNAATGNCSMVLAEEDAVLAAAFSPDERYIITGSADGTVRLWSMATGRQVMTLGEARGTAVVSTIFSVNERRIVTASINGVVRLWMVAASAPMATFDNGALVNAAAFSPDGRRIATASADATVRLWDLASGERIAILRGHKTEIKSVAFDPTGRCVVTASRDGTARMWRVFQNTQALIDEARRVVAEQLS